MKRLIACIVIIVIIAVIGIVILISNRDKAGIFDVLDGDDMVRKSSITCFSYSRYGGELGSSYDLILDGNKLTVSECEGHGAKTYTKEYTVPMDKVYSIEEIILEADMKHWTNLPDQEYFELDGETTSVSITFNDGVNVRFNSDKQWPEGGGEAVRSVVNILEQIADK